MARATCKGSATRKGERRPLLLNADKLGVEEWKRNIRLFVICWIAGLCSGKMIYAIRSLLDLKSKLSGCIQIFIVRSQRLADTSRRSARLAKEPCLFTRKVLISLRPFCPCLCRNVVAVPVPAPETWEILSAHHASAEGGCGGPTLTPPLCSRIWKIFDLALASGRDLWDFEGTPWIVTDELEESDSGLGDDPIDPAAPAYFQYTSGSTSSPSGVVITHKSLMHYLGALHKSCGYGDGVTVTWMPHFHDYGLVQGLLQPLFSGDPCYLMSPLSFLKRPTHWLGAIRNMEGRILRRQISPMSIVFAE